MPYDVHIRRVSTGEERIHHEDGEWVDGSWSHWADGNYSCDCNRKLFFHDWGNDGELSDDETDKCSDGKYLVKIVLPDGSVTLDEFTHGHGYWP